MGFSSQASTKALQMNKCLNVSYNRPAASLPPGSPGRQACPTHLPLQHLLFNLEGLQGVLCADQLVLTAAQGQTQPGIPFSQSGCIPLAAPSLPLLQAGLWSPLASVLCLQRPRTSWGLVAPGSNSRFQRAQSLLESLKHVRGSGSREDILPVPWGCLWGLVGFLGRLIGPLGGCSRSPARVPINFFVSPVKR